MAMHNFSWVIPGRLAGCEIPEKSDELSWLADQGIRRLVSLQKPPFDIETMCTEIGLVWSYYPIIDFSVPNNKKSFSGLIDSIVQSISNGEPCCIHCHAGIGRTGMVLACVIGQHLSLDGKTAIKTVRRSRSAIDTEEQSRFVFDYLRKYEN